ncbi:methylated-DNA--[protein]-cysteine S-methyltransferase [Betaproteobacteria bacterium PRO7]|jgi:methylated-DNA-[protein]-cysteine S-methyltransferase|nr:methylated-DNA--[protein]-cysteine S-methyltransferase [Burkholderiaceae bacterium]MDL1861723.1 methylated-DNA--[protein]-cysteine S-methyltransferase [Betaproteobacteria bacterium PRO7]GIL06589.1 MAG: methylated-DNA--protein-cysteine methyltransferase [Betaproteobacteria bacterium]
MTIYTLLDSPLGKLALTSDGGHLTGIHFPRRDGRPAVERAWQRDDAAPVLARARTQLAEYFDGRRTRFDLPLRPAGTAFQQSVWRALLKVPFGRTSTYGALAAEIGRPTAARAVGAAVGANPLAVVVPCHRIIGADGTLTGYAGGLPRKTKLLALEGTRGVGHGR